MRRIKKRSTCCWLCVIVGISVTGTLARAQRLSVVPAVSPANSPDVTSDGQIQVLLNSGHTVVSQWKPRLFLTPDARFAASFITEGTSNSNVLRLHLWNLVTGRKVAEVSEDDLPNLQNTYANRNCAVSVNGQFLVACSGRSTFLYDLFSDQVIGKFKGVFGSDENTTFREVDPFSSDGRLFWVCDKNNLSIIETNQPDRIRQIAGVSGTRGEFSPSGDRLLIESHKSVRLIDVRSGQVLQEYSKAKLPRNSRAFCRDGQRFLLSFDHIRFEDGDEKAGKRNGVSVFDRSGALVKHFKLSANLRSSATPLVAHLSPDGSLLFHGIRNGSIATILNVDSGSSVLSLGQGLLAASFSDNNHLVAAFRDGGSYSEYYRIDRIDAASGEIETIRRIEEDGFSYGVHLHELVVDPVRETVTARIRTSVCQSWSLNGTGKGRSTRFIQSVGQPTHLTFDPLEHCFLVARQSPERLTDEQQKPLVTLWNTASGQPVFRSQDFASPPTSSEQSGGGLQLGPGGRFLFVPGRQGYQYGTPGSSNQVTSLSAFGTLVSLDSATRAHTHRIGLSAGSIVDSKFRPDNRTLLIATVEPDPRKDYSFSGVTLKTIDVATGRVLRELRDKLPQDSYGSVTISPSGNRMAAVRDFHPNAADPRDLDVHVWDIDQWDNGPQKLLLPRLAGGTRPYKPQFADDKTLLLLGHYSISKIDLETQRETNTGRFLPKTHNLRVFGDKAVFVADSTTTGGKRVGIADLNAKRVLATIPGATAQRVWLTPNGKLCLSLMDDGWCEVLDSTSLELLCRFITLANGEDWIVVTPDGLFDGSYNARQQVSFRLGEGLNVVPVDRFFQDFYHPGLLAAIWRGERPRPQVSLGDELPPLLAIESSPQDGESLVSRVEIIATAKNLGGGVKGPWIKHNGARLIGAVKSTERTEDGVRRIFSVDLIEGENHLEVISASADGSFESEPVTLTMSYNRPLPKSRLHVLVVGVNDYADPSLQMNFAANDADRIAQVFATRGGSLYADINVVSLKNKAATAAGILKSIETLAQQANAQDTVVVFVSGHGSLLDRNFYFLPHDFERTIDSFEDDIRQHGLAAIRIGDALAQVPALKRMIVFDTGQSGEALPVRSLSRNPFAFRGAIERLARAQGAFTIASAAVSDNAAEVESLGHGVLAYSFLAGLKAVESGPLLNQWVRPASDDQVAQALELFTFASSHSRQLGRQYFGKEQEVQYSSLGMTFPVLPVKSNQELQSPQSVTMASLDTTPESSESDSQTFDKSDNVSTLYVVSVGINEYAESSMSLKYAASDAKAVGDLFQARGRSLFGNVVIKSVLNAKATHANISAAINEVAQSAGPNDTLAVFLAGHGTMLGQRYYFIPADFRRESSVLDDDIRSQAFAADELGELISKIPASQRLIVFDTCASGGAIELNRQGADPFAFRSAIEQIGKDGGTFTLAAVGSQQEAQEVSELDHGILSYCLLAAAGAVNSGPLAQRPAQVSGKARKMDVLEWFSYAAGHAPRLTKQYFGNEQQVQLGGRGAAFHVLQLP